ncbi:MAG: DUF1116 domain-containing protein [Actinomycetia bacterium]|nr:DUF1116 domain-containing protein [Actinomycetes bacterium]
MAASGAAMLSDALRAQGITVADVAWRPPPTNLIEPLDRIAADPRRVEANQTAVTAMMEARPHVVGITEASQALGLGRRQFLHSGPPIDWERASGPLRGALIGAMLFEGEADTVEEAERICARGEIELAPCHGRGAVGPMAGVISASMPLYHLQDDATGRSAYSNLNEGLGKVLRMGAYAPEVIDRLRWMRSVLGPVLSDAFAQAGPFDVRSALAQALQMGDEGHNRNRAGSALFLREMAAAIVEAPHPTTDLGDVFRFIDGNEHFVLNMVMPAAKLAADGGRDIGGSTMVVAMARNGTDFGIQVSGTGDRWFTAPANTPRGILFAGFSDEDVNPDIGDSTIMETYGIGGFAMACAPAIVRFVGGSAALANEKTLSMYEITLAENPYLQIAPMDFRGSPTGIDVTRVVTTGLLPAVNTGMAGRIAGTGQVGAGLVDPPMACFEQAVTALGDGL